MAISASIALSPSSVQINEPCAATVTISNSGGSAVQVLAIQPTIMQTGSSLAVDKTPAALGVVPLSSGFPNMVPAGGSLSVAFGVCAFEPSITTYDVSCIILTQGNVYTIPTAATLTVTQVNFQDAT